METRSCKNCKNDFIIDSDDFSFYEKIKVPPPTWCPECRLIRRFSFQNTWNLHWRNCDKCGEKTLSVYPPDQKLTVYCQPCWWKDDWDGTEYAMEYDTIRPFFEQMNELINKTPNSALTSLYTSLKNSNYSNALAWSKDCYLIFWADFCENAYYSTLLDTLKFSADCLRAKDSELCYESLGINKCYRTFFSEECDNCVDIWFSRNCYNCTNCVGCINLRGESYCIFNVKYSKEEYFEKLSEIHLESSEQLQILKKKAEEFWLSKPHRSYSGNSLNLNVTGEYVYESKNSQEMYLCSGAEDCKWCQFITVAPARDCRDYSGWGNNATQIYESTVVGENSNAVSFSCECWPDSLNLEYCYWNIAGKNNFGCANLKRKKYCILNKEYSKEEYEELKDRIIEDMKNTPYVDAHGRAFLYGEFFPLSLSKFAYNKSNAMRFFPKTKEQALSEGYQWVEIENPIHTTTMEASQIPDTILYTPDKILNETVACSSCKRAYKIVAGELDLLRKMNIPVPHECPKCRENRRFARCNLPRLYDRNCMNCGASITTAYAPDRPEIVYCESCYQKEFI